MLRNFHKRNFENVYIIGDIHGDFKLLEHILMEIKFIVKSKFGYKQNPKVKNACIIQIGVFYMDMGD